MSLPALLMLVLAATIVAVNLLYSVLCAMQYRLRECHWPPTPPTGIPMAGTFAVLCATALADGAVPMAGIVTLIAADTGGPIALTVDGLRRWHDGRSERQRITRLHTRVH